MSIFKQATKMKTKLFLVIAFALSVPSVNAQTYFPFPDTTTNATWSVEFGYYDIMFGHQVTTGTAFYGILGDTIIDTNSYVKVYCSTDSAFSSANTTFCYSI